LQWQVEQNITQEFLHRARQRRTENEFHLGEQDSMSLYQPYRDHYQKVQHALLLNPAPQFAPPANWSGTSFADVSIVGFSKAGTSQLYRWLTTHPHAAPFHHALKEYCIDHGKFLDYTSSEISNSSLFELQKKLWWYHKDAHGRRQQVDEKQQQQEQQEHTKTNTTDKKRNNSNRVLLINACCQTSEIEYHAAYTALPSTAKFIILFRDPADWLWASWNFWYDEELDALTPTTHNWASDHLHYRSPELFHELIISHGLLRAGANRRGFSKRRREAVHTPRHMSSLVGRSNVLYLKNEDMQPETIFLQQDPNGLSTSSSSSSSFLVLLANFTGLEVSLFDQSVVSSRTNCNSNKGTHTVCSSSSSRNSSSSSSTVTASPAVAAVVGTAPSLTQESGAYAISHHRPMLQATRQFIYLQYHEECQVWAKEFGIFYHDCLNAVPKP
jgi:chromatin remodeling complex protein RSC6